MIYQFKEVSNCEMCGDATDKHKMLGQRLNKSQGLSPKEKTGVCVSIKKCTNCNLIYCSPQPIPNDIQDHYGVPPEDYWNPDYFNWTPKYFSKQIKTAKKTLPFKKNMKALDVGAGLGKAMLSLESASFNTFGFEPSETFYEKAITKMNISPHKLKLGAIENVAYEDEIFDFITFGAVFEHLYHPAQSLDKALSWLKPNGIIHIEVPSSDWLISKMINLYYNLRGTNYVTNLSPMHPPYHLYEFGIKSFKELSSRLNFNIEKYYYDVCTIYNVPMIFHPILRRYMEWSNTGMQLTVYLRKN